MTSNTPRVRYPLGVPLTCALAGAALFQFFGNANRGYIDTSSLFYWWGYQWANRHSEMEHGWLILGLSVGLLGWRLRKRETGDGGVSAAGGRADEPAAEPPIPNNRTAVAAMLGGLLLHAVGFAAQQARLSVLALLLFTWGVLRLAGGKRWGDAALFPVAFMVFAIPINALDSVGFWLRVWVVDASSAIARAAGVGVLQGGTQLVAPDGRYNYDVAAACSGVRSLTAMAALSLLAGYLNFGTWTRRALALLLCFPLVYLGNVARIVCIIFAAEWGGPKWGDIAHEIMGYGIFAIVLGGVLGGIRLIERWWPEGRAGRPACPPKEVVTPATDGRAARPWLIALAVVALVCGEMAFLHHLVTSPPRGLVGVALAPDGRDPVELPAFLGTDWAGRRAEVSLVERQTLPPDTGYSRKNYIPLSRAGPEVFLSIVLSGRDRTSIHRPELCLVGQGWTILGQRGHLFQAPARPGVTPRAAIGPTGGHFPATVLQVRREVQTPKGKASVPQLVVYWFVGGDTIVASHWERMACDAWNRVAHARADRWAYVLMQTDARDGEAAALARMQAVLDGALPVIQPKM
ncbi:MAG TPA: exosortase/archaeosortase family protein [Opitutaceae bacterium]|nr:exosortase/archaeosortase family protein [Opitutaceae bacterium]